MERTAARSESAICSGAIALRMHDGAAVGHQHVGRREHSQGILELARRLVELRLGDTIGGCLLDIADLANDGHPGQWSLLHADMDALADRVLAGPIVLSERAIHDRHHGRIGAVRLGEAASAKDAVSRQPAK